MIPYPIRKKAYRRLTRKVIVINRDKYRAIPPKKGTQSQVDLFPFRKKETDLGIEEAVGTLLPDHLFCASYISIRPDGLA